MSAAADFDPDTERVPVTVFVRGANHGYPWRSVCPCGWASRGYAARHAADTMGAEHECPAR